MENKEESFFLTLTQQMICLKKWETKKDEKGFGSLNHS